MNKPFILISLLFAITNCTISKAQVKGDVILAYTVANGAGIGLDSKSMYPFIAGFNLEKKISKKLFTPWTVHTRLGLRYCRSGYGLDGYMETEQEYYKKYNISNYSQTKSMLVQSFISAPIGLEFRLKPMPATTKNYLFSVSFLLNGSYLLASNLNERVYSFSVGSELTQAVVMKDYTEKFHWGGTIEFKFTRFFNMGFMYQPISYKNAKDALTFNFQSGSPYYEVISHKGVYRDFSFYMGINIPLSTLKKKNQ